MFNPLFGNCHPLYLLTHPETVRTQVFLESIFIQVHRAGGGQAATAKNNILAIEDATVDLDDFDTSESDVAVDKRGGRGIADIQFKKRCFPREVCMRICGRWKPGAMYLEGM